MWQLTWLDAGPGLPGMLLITLHHLVTDGVSADPCCPTWPPPGRTSGRAWPAFDPVPTSFRWWARQLELAAADPARVAELPGWARIGQDADPPLTTRNLHPGHRHRPAQHPC